MEDVGVAECPFLPLPLWKEICRLALATAAAADHVAVCRTACALLATSHHVASATREVHLCLDLRSAPEGDLELLLPLLTAMPLAQLLLAPRHASGEALLRCDALVALSGPSLRRLAASVACTDTLQRFPGLTRLDLHAGVLERLYTAVLHGLPALRRLGLHEYRELDLAHLLPSVASSLQVLEVTPRPEAMWCRLEVRLPQGAHLHRLAVHGSFQRILSTKAAPEVVVDTRALARQCSEVHIEARHVVWQLPASCRGQPSVEVALAATLLRCHASAWRRLEMQVLEGAFAELPPTLGPAGLPPRRVQLDLEQLMQEVLCLGGGQVRTSLRPIPASIFQSWVLVLQRDEPAVTGAGSGVEEEH